MKIEVTAKHIKKGRHVSATRCPVALAIREALGFKNSCVSVGVTVFTIKNNSKRLPKKVSNFVIAFDAGEKVEPFEFKI